MCIFFDTRWLSKPFLLRNCKSVFSCHPLSKFGTFIWLCFTHKFTCGEPGFKIFGGEPQKRGRGGISFEGGESNLDTTISKWKTHKNKEVKPFQPVYLKMCIIVLKSHFLMAIIQNNNKSLVSNRWF